jgi:hypothetical protein
MFAKRNDMSSDGGVTYISFQRQELLLFVPSASESWLLAYVRVFKIGLVVRNTRTCRSGVRSPHRASSPSCSHISVQVLCMGL